MSTKRIKKINPLQAGKVSAVIAVLLILIIFVPIMLLISAAGFGGNQSAFGPLMGGGIIAIVILMPIIYGIFAFLIGIFYAFIYNVTYRFHGGLEMEYDDMDDEINRIGS